MPPERDLDPHGPINYASDIWSLGVVYLEMLTVLRSARSKEFWDHLKQKGTQYQYVFRNPTGVTSWLEHLRQRPGPSYDNIPQSWVKDMLVRDPNQRPYAKQLRSQIVETGHFCGFCCSFIEHENDSVDQFEAQYEVQSVSFSDQGVGLEFEGHTEGHQDVGKVQSIQTWIKRTEVYEVKAQGTAEVTGNFHFEIEDDDDLTEIPVDRGEEYARPATQKFNAVDFVAGFDHGSAEPLDTELTFDVEQDGSIDSASEVTLELGGPDSTSDLASIKGEIDELCDSANPAGALATIFEEDGKAPAVQRPRVAFVEEVQGTITHHEDTSRLELTYEQSEPRLPESNEQDQPATSGADGETTKNSQTSPLRLDLAGGAISRAALTIGNLAQLDSGTTPRLFVPQRPRVNRSSPRFSPRKYMRRVTVETDSEVTSVMSEGSRKKIQGLSLTVWASKSAPLLENYVRAGKVTVVRALLDAGCKPTTKVCIHSDQVAMI